MLSFKNTLTYVYIKVLIEYIWYLVTVLMQSSIDKSIFKWDKNEFDFCMFEFFRKYKKIQVGDNYIFVNYNSQFLNILLYFFIIYEKNLKYEFDV